MDAPVSQTEEAKAGVQQEVAVPESATPLSGGYEILQGSPLPHLDTAWGKACAARRKGAEAPLYALIPNGRLPCRSEIFSSMRKAEQPFITALEDVGIIRDAGDGMEKRALVFRRPPGERLWPDLSVPRPPMGEDEIIRQVVRPVVQALQFLWSRGIHHGGIRPSNMFWGPAGVILGECVSEPPSFSQPVLFETFERALAHPAGRGDGNSRDDVFSLGVSIVFLCLGQSPLSGIPDDEVMLARGEAGSYATLLARQRMPVGLVEPLRGMLSDDPSLRWDVSDLAKWMGGHRQAAKSAKGQQVSARPLSFAGRDWHRARSLAMALPSHGEDAVRILQNGDLGRWLRRSLADQATADRVEALLSEEGLSKDRLLSRMILALDPSAPIFWHGVRALPGGIGNLLAALAMSGGDAAPVAEMISQQLPGAWLSVQPRFEQIHGDYARTFDRLHTLVMQTGNGFGPERCLYELGPGLPCFSPLMKGKCVLTSGDVLRHLEEHPDLLDAGGTDNANWPLDRHLVAFLAARERLLPEALLKNSAMTGPAIDRVLAFARILAFVQEKQNIQKLPHLAGWLAGHAHEAVGRFHDRTARRKITASLAGVAARGNLLEMVALLSDAGELGKDDDAFMEARQQYHRIVAGVARMRKESGQRRADAAALGQRIAVVISSVISGLFLLAMFSGGFMTGGRP